MMEMQGNATEIDERNLLQLDALLSHGYGLSPQLVMRSKGLSHRGEGTLRIPELICRRGGHGFPINFPHSRRA